MPNVIASICRCWHDSNPVALYRFHRKSCGFGRLKAFGRSLYCWL